MQHEENTEVTLGRTTVHGKEEQLFAHVVWHTKDDAPLLSHEDIRQAAHRAVVAKAREFRCRVLAVGGTADHVHVLFRFPGSVPVSMLTRQVKEAAAQAVVRAQTIGEYAEIQRDTVWSAVFGLRTVGSEEVAAVTAYVEQQQELHQSGAARTEFETVQAELEVGLRPAMSYLVRESAGVSRLENAGSPE